MKRAPWFWIAWGLVGIAVEAVAIANGVEGDTLSEQVWWLLRINPVLWFTGAGFLVWLVLHFLVRTYRRP